MLAGIADGKRSAVPRTDDVAHRLGDVIGVVFRLRNAKVIARPDVRLRWVRTLCLS